MCGQGEDGTAERVCSRDVKGGEGAEGSEHAAAFADAEAESGHVEALHGEEDDFAGDSGESGGAERQDGDGDDQLAVGGVSAAEDAVAERGLGSVFVPDPLGESERGREGDAVQPVQLFGDERVRVLPRPCVLRCEDPPVPVVQAGEVVPGRVSDGRRREHVPAAASADASERVREGVAVRSRVEGGRREAGGGNGRVWKEQGDEREGVRAYLQHGAEDEGDGESGECGGRGE